MNAAEAAAALDAMDDMVALVRGYQAKLEAAGFSPTAAEMMAIQWHQMLMASATATANHGKV